MTTIMKKFIAAFLIVLALALTSIINTSKLILVLKDQITSPGRVSKTEDVVRSDKIGTESSLIKNDVVQDASVVVVDIDLLKDQNHNNEQEDEVIDEKENDPIPRSTEIMADHIETELGSNT